MRRTALHLPPRFTQKFATALIHKCFRRKWPYVRPHQMKQLQKKQMNKCGNLGRFGNPFSHAGQVGENFAFGKYRAGSQAGGSDTAFGVLRILHGCCHGSQLSFCAGLYLLCPLRPDIRAPDGLSAKRFASLQSCQPREQLGNVVLGFSTPKPISPVELVCQRPQWGWKVCPIATAFEC